MTMHGKHLRNKVQHTFVSLIVVIMILMLMLMRANVKHLQTGISSVRIRPPVELRTSFVGSVMSGSALTAVIITAVRFVLYVIALHVRLANH